MRLSLPRLKDQRRTGELLGIALLGLALLSILSIASYDQFDRTWFHYRGSSGPVHNWIGLVGATLAETLLQLFGVLAFSIPIALAVVGWRRFRGRAGPTSYWRLGAWAAFSILLAALTALLFGPVAYGGELQTFLPGGLVGLWASELLVTLLNEAGAIIVAATLIAALIVALTRVSFAYAADRLRDGAVRAGHGAAAVAGTLKGGLPSRARPGRAARPAPPSPPSASRGAVAAEPPAVAPRASIRVEDAGGAEADADSPASATAEASRRATSSRPRAPRQATLPMDPGKRGYALPPLDLLKEPQPQFIDAEKELLERARELTEKFREFAVDGSVVAIHPGPVVTTFEFKPDAGVKYSKITGMIDDLCLALKAESVRIDRMPGRSTVGIEVPNRRQETIFPRELIASPRFQASRSKLTLALGKDVGGEVFVAELDRMPHLLIAGATGAGKSVMLNGMIVSILYKATPEQVRFIMIDTKMIELGIYADIPHLLVPVVTDPKHASTALQWAVREMEQRYHRLAALGVRNIAQFNAELEKDPGLTMEDPKGGEPIPLEPLPYIVIVIDEMADLMMVSSADVEESVMRLAQMARAVGIHLILATQRPSVDVITGTIKANFPSRIAFRVSQRVDSRTIIDQNGAEQLLGRGDMLYLATGAPRLLRLHSGFITEPELNRLTAFLKKMARPRYDETVLEEPDETRPGYEGGDRDVMFVDAVRLILQEGQCSITLIQRRLRLGYARAARIVDMMEQEGVVGPADGSKPRELLVGPDYLERLEASVQ